MTLRSISFAGILCTAAVPPAFANLTGDLGSLGFPPEDYYERAADDEFFPEELSPAQDRRLRAVLNRLHVWEPRETVTVCFLSGTQKARVRIMKAAQEWTRWAKLGLDFGPEDNPRMCDRDRKNEAADIKIGFASVGRRGGYWSYLGTQSREYAHSMNLQGFGGDSLPETLSEARFRGVVLHEFGHALGLEHEHQSPNARCEDEFDWEAIYAWGEAAGWPRAVIDLNFRRLVAGESERRFSAYDPDSIMHYSLPATFFKEGRASKCYVEENTTLSEGDKTFIARIYPAAPKAREPYTGFLIAEFRAILEEAGIPEAEIESRLAALPAVFNITAVTAGGDAVTDGGVKIEGDVSADDGSVQIIGGQGSPSVSVERGNSEDGDEEGREDDGPDN